MAKEAAEKPVVGVDLGGTKVLAGVVDRDYKILRTAKKATKGEMGVDTVVERIAKTVRDAIQGGGPAARRPGRRLLGRARAR